MKCPAMNHNYNVRRLFGSAAVLAGGKSRRMGFDKRLLKAGGGTLIETLEAKLRKVFSEVLLSVNDSIYPRPDVRTITDEYSGLGPLAGIHACLTAAESEYVYFTACDMPIINYDYIEYMRRRIALAGGCDACVTLRGNRLEPFNAFYGRSAVRVIAEDLAQGKASIRRALAKLNTIYIDEHEARKFSPDFAMFLNLNTPKEYCNFFSSLY